MERITYKQITDYENGFNTYFFNLRKETYYSNTHDSFDNQINNIPSSDNSDLYNHKKNFNINSRQMLLNILDLFKCIDNYKNPKINTEKRNLQDYKSCQINRISEYEFQIKNRFESLNVYSLHIKSLISNGNLLDAYNLKNYIIPKLGYYKNYLSQFGIDIEKTTLIGYFSNLSDMIDNSINTDELKFINDLQIKQTTEPQNIDFPEHDFSDTVPLEKMIILEKLGIIKYIQSLQNDNNNEKQTAEILSAITGIISGTIAKNLGVMLGVKKNDNDKNSPYKNPKNLQLANNKFNQFNIDLTKILR